MEQNKNVKQYTTQIVCPTCDGKGRIMHYGGVDLTCHNCQGMGGISLPSCKPVRPNRIDESEVLP